ncbi:MAG TPA: hypothetical protein VGR32_05265 [Brevundimonas sp.]|uniref:hypothetical protein n=1 Tax=Brevundimonas sp. TaxID=1871086 RepID=UPI002DF5573E|nr:hypothetical protein [Brevundimonas sp.]
MIDAPRPTERTSESDPIVASAAAAPAGTPSPPNATLSLEEWQNSQPPRALLRAPRAALAHIYKGDAIKPRAALFEPIRKHVRLDWVSIFREAAKSRAEAEAIGRADDSEKS